MAYVNKVSGAQRAPIMIAVAALQAGAILALINGLGVIISPPNPDPPLSGYQIDLPRIDETKPPETITPIPTPNAVPTQSTNEGIKLPTELATGPDIGEFPSGGEAASEGPITPLMPPPTLNDLPPNLAAKPASPRGSPGLWVTSDDYPARSLRERHEGMARFRLTIGADGSVRDCAIVVSSGHPELDLATCANLTRRGKFTAATDGSGKSVAGSYTGSVRWRLPRDY